MNFEPVLLSIENEVKLYCGNIIFMNVSMNSNLYDWYISRQQIQRKILMMIRLIHEEI